MSMSILLQEGLSGINNVLEALINETMLFERETHLQAGRYERSENRVDYANGFKTKTLKTRVGELQLNVPQVRQSKFYPSILEKGIRSERALIIALAEMYHQGVSTRKVTKILEKMSDMQITSDMVSRASKTLDVEVEKFRTKPLGQYDYMLMDAMYEDVRMDGSVQGAAVLIAVGVKNNQREIIGLSVSLSEAEIHWREFFKGLVTRGLHGLKMITSDDHAGMRAARKAVFTGVPWQRCQFHLQQNAQSYITKVSLKKSIAAEIKSVFDCLTKDEAERGLKEFIQRHESSMPRLTDWAENNLVQGFTVFDLRESPFNRKRLRTSNVMERLNKTIRKRTKVVGVFPNDESCIRLIGSILLETTEAWKHGKQYLT